MCEWSGITCNAAKNVTAIELPAADLLATLPTELGLLSSMAVIDLKKNLILGTLPTEIANLPHLVVCILAENELNGEIPSFVSPSLKTLDLSHNSFEGKLVPDFGTWNVLLTYIDMQYNFLTGYLPFGLERLTHLNSISFTNNRLSGTLPNFVGSLPNLQYLYLNKNDFVGAIPAAWGGYSTSLKEVWLQDNLLSGQVPGTLAEIITLEDLYLDGNKLTGEMPPDLCTANLNADFFAQIVNQTSPKDYCDSVACPINTVSLDGLYPCHDCPRQEVQNPYLGRTGECVQLTEGVIVGNLLGKGNARWEVACFYHGVTCDHMGRVIKINAASQGLSGSIPDELGYLRHLKELDLSDNRFTGYLPSGLRFAPLEVLDVSGNQLRGIVPPLMCGMDKVNGNGVDGDFDCTNIACPAGTYSPTGWGDCMTCNKAGMSFLGSKYCGSKNLGSSITAPNPLSNESRPLWSPVSISLIVIGVLVPVLTFFIYTKKGSVRRERVDNFDARIDEYADAWRLDEERSSFPHTEELKARLKRLHKGSSPGQWLRKYWRRAQSYAISLSETEEVRDKPGTKKVKVYEGEIDDFGWKERDSILKHRDIERAVERQRDTSSLTVWEYPDPLERDALSTTSAGDDTRFSIDDDESPSSDSSCHDEQKEMFLDVPRIE